MNKVIISGSLGHNPSAAFTAGGKAITKFSIANNSGYGDNKRTDWLDIVCFGKTAEVMADHLNKGSKVLVEGRLQIDKWEKDGQKHSKPSIVADSIEFLDSKKSEPQADAAAAFGGQQVFPPDEEIPF